MGELLELALKLEKGRWDRAITMRVGHAMRRLGWPHTRRRVDDTRTAWVYLAPPKASAAAADPTSTAA
jgi:hypothetical protein